MHGAVELGLFELRLVAILKQGVYEADLSDPGFTASSLGFDSPGLDQCAPMRR